MITADTLEKVAAVKVDLGTVQDKLDKLVLIEQGNWQPGNGEKPHRMRELQKLSNQVEAISAELEQLWS